MIRAANDQLPLSHHVAANIRAELARQGLQQAELAAALSLTPQAISQKLNIHRRLGLDELQAIAGVLGMEPEDLLRRPRAWSHL